MKQTIDSVLAEIRESHPAGYTRLADDMAAQIREYHASLPEWEGHRSPKPRLLVPLSGGIDSAVVTGLAVQAAGFENVVTLTMPSYEGDDCIPKSQEVNLHFTTLSYTLSVQPIVEAEMATLSRFVGLRFNDTAPTEMDRMRRGNLASRARVAIMYDVARVINAKLLGTGNRAEFVQGYSAKWGTPTSFDFGVLDDLYKADVYGVAEVLNMPASIVNAAPSTGYFPGQTHEQELGATMQEQDAAAYLLFEKGLDRKTILETVDLRSDVIDAMLARYARCADKRMLRQPHVRVRAFKDG